LGILRYSQFDIDHPTHITCGCDGLAVPVLRENFCRSGRFIVCAMLGYHVAP
jgi:hypothetical protein